MSHWYSIGGMVLAAVTTILSGCQGKADIDRKSSDRQSPIVQPAARDGSPTIILVYADDLDWETLDHDWDPVDGQATDQTQSVKFPVLKEMSEQGIVFSNFHITTPVCGPSRACLLSGQYAHRNNVRVNEPSNWISHGFTGGALAFDPTDSLAPWMKQAGYQTCFVGKYLHHDYAPRAELNESWASIRPPGWDWFQPALGARYYKYWLLENETSMPEIQADRYRTDAETDEITNLLNNWNPNGGPQFICWLPVAPHIDVYEGGMAAERHLDWCDESLPPELERHFAARPTALPPELGVLPENAEEQLEEIIQSWRDRLRATKALDEGLGRIRELLRRQGRLENTIFVFSSDHGFRMGQHGHVGKRLPYDRITRVPTIVCGAGIAPGRCNEVLANIDIAPTLVELAGGRIPVCPDEIDGRSFAALLEDPGKTLEPPRSGVLLEHWESEINGFVTIPAAWSAWRTKNHLYTEWATGGREYYDLANDPEQLQNLYPQLPAAERRELASLLANSRTWKTDPLITDMLAGHETILTNPVSANFIPLPLTGYVEAARGVANVELEFQCPETGEFWDGQQWTFQPSRVSAELDNPGGQISRWSYALDSSSSVTEQVEVSERVVNVKIAATDSGDNQSSRSFQPPITMRFDDPESWIDRPEDLSGGCRPMLVTGRAADNSRVTRVVLVIHDKETTRFWNGSHWVPDYVAVDTELQPGDVENEVHWSYQLTASSDNRVFVGSRAIDDQKNYDRSLPFFEFLPVEIEDE